MNDSHLRLETIFEHFPQEWRGFLGALSVSCDQLVSAEAWLSSHLYNRTAHPVAWETLLQTLSEEEPVSSKEGLIFKPRICFLPLNVQRGLITMIHHHREEMTIPTLRTFIGHVISHCSHDSWLQALMAMLSEHCVNNSSSERVYHFSVGGEQKMAEICGLLEKQDSFCDDIWTPNLMKQSQVKVSDPLGQREALGSFSQWSMSADGPMSVDEEAVPVSNSQLITNSSMHNTQEADSESFQKEEVLIPQDMQVELKKLKELWHSSGTDSVVMEHDLLIFNQCTEDQMLLVCDSLELHLLDDAILQRVCQQVRRLEPEISFTNCVIFLQKSLLMKIQSLDQNASRVLMNTVLAVSKEFPRQTIDGVLVPLLSVETVGPPSADLVTKALKEFSESHRQTFLSSLLSKLEVLNEPVLQVGQSILDNKTHLDSAHLSSLLQVMRQHSLAFSHNLKFSKLILTIITKYRTQLNPENISAADEMSQNNETFMKKALVAAVKKLKSS